MDTALREEINDQHFISKKCEQLISNIYVLCQTYRRRCDAIAFFLAFYQSISNSFQKEKQITTNNLQQTNYNKLCYKKKCNNIDISIYYRYKLSSSVFICLGLFVRYIPRDHTH